MVLRCTMDLFSKWREQIAPIHVRFLLVPWAKGYVKRKTCTAAWLPALPVAITTKCIGAVQDPSSVARKASGQMHHWMVSSILEVPSSWVRFKRAVVERWSSAKAPTTLCPFWPQACSELLTNARQQRSRRIFPDFVTGAFYIVCIN